MTEGKQNLTENHVNQQIDRQSANHIPTSATGIEVKKSHGVPVITLTGLTLVIVCPILFVAHLYVANLIHIPILQYGFVTILVAFAINYTFIIRKYQMLPCLPDERYDNQLKFACLLAFAGILCSLMWGWNGSGGLIFAVFWQKFRGNKIGSFKYFYAIIIVGSLIMQKNLSLMKLVEFIPGILFGIANSIAFTLKESSTYVLAHQFIFLTSICFPMFFPTTHLVVPNLYQWIAMIVTGFSMLLTVILTVKLMQGQRVSVVMAVMSGIIMIGTTSYIGMIDFFGALLILVGIVLIIKKEFLDLEF